MSKPVFEQHQDEIISLIARRKNAWEYTSLESWDEVKQGLLTHIFTKWETFDPARAPKLEVWVNKLITNQLKNKRRDLYLRFAKPCIGGGGKLSGRSCTYNLGGTSCSAPWVKSGVQCAECPLYANWLKGRQYQFHVRSTVSLENHAQEVSNQQSDFTDIEAIQEDMHRKMLDELTAWERRVYRYLYVQHLTPSETTKKLKVAADSRKTELHRDEGYDYTYVIHQQRRFKDMMYEILRRQGYDLKLFEKKGL